MPKCCLSMTCPECAAQLNVLRQAIKELPLRDWDSLLREGRVKDPAAFFAVEQQRFLERFEGHFRNDNPGFQWATGKQNL